jgi:fibronectin type 3 domain-containing protein
VTAAAILDQPSSLKAVSAGYDRVKITWSKVAGADSYRVYRKTAGSGWTRVKDVETLTLTDTGLTTGTEYIYTVRACTGSVISSYDTRGVTAVPLPSRPENLAAVSVDYDSIQVSWSKSYGAAAYAVYRKASGETSWTRVKNVTGTSYTDTGLTAGTSYVYTVRAYRNSAYSSYDTKGVTAVPVLPQPVLGTATASTGYVTVRWKKVASATGYRVFRKTSGGRWTALTTISKNSTVSYADKTAKSGTTYYYTVRAYRTQENTTLWSTYSTSGVKATAK